MKHATRFPVSAMTHPLHHPKRHMKSKFNINSWNRAKVIQEQQCLTSNNFSCNFVLVLNASNWKFAVNLPNIFSWTVKTSRMSHLGQTSTSAAVLGPMWSINNNVRHQIICLAIFLLVWMLNMRKTAAKTLQQSIHGQCNTIIGSFESNFNISSCAGTKVIQKQHVVVVMHLHIA